MRHDPVSHEPLLEAKRKMWFKPFMVKILAVDAELTEQEKEHRDISQERMGELFGVDPRNLRTWTDKYRAEKSVEALRARGGQGRKPKLSDEEVKAAIKKGQEGGGFQSDPEAEADNCGACREAAEAKRAAEAGEKKRPARRAEPPAACSCDAKGRECDHPGGCQCKPGKACACKCCRNPKLPKRGPPHVSGCPRARVWPMGALTVAILQAVIFDMYGIAYSASRMYAIMAKHGLVSKKLRFVHINHAGCDAVRAWQRRLKVRLKKLREAGYAIASFDECFMVRDKATGRVWVEMGRDAVQIYTGSKERIALFGYYFENCTQRFQEYKFADSYALFHSLKRIADEFGKVAIIMDRASPHNSKTTRRLLREYRRDNPGHDIQLIFLPRGSPYLNVVEECWALLKREVAQFYYYPEFDDFRWAVTGYLRTKRFWLDMEDFLYRNPRQHLPAAK